MNTDGPGWLYASRNICVHLWPSGFAAGMHVGTGWLPLTRRTLRLILLLLALTARAAAARPFNFDDVVGRAQKLAQEPYQDPHGQVPEWLIKLSYDQWRD